MIQLAIETSSRIGSIAVVRDKEVLAFRTNEPLKGHGRLLLSEVSETLKAAGVQVSDVDVFIANVGPGSFTGVRVGLAAARAMAWSRKRPVVGADGLRALARSRSALGSTWISPVLDARKGEVYCALFRRVTTGLELVVDAAAMRPERWMEDVSSLIDDDVVFVGDGVPLLPSGIDGYNVPVDARELVHAARDERNSRGVWREAIPRYIRPAEAEVKFGLAPSHCSTDHVVRSDGYRSKQDK